LAKTYSLYKAGMKPFVFSKQKFMAKNGGEEPIGLFNPVDHKDFWHSDCDNIKYFQNDIERLTSDATKFATNIHSDKFL
jgi:hypothetical protein